ncbi:hypothetical protein EDI_136780 [Entamoeba dispar SAW760]|uniref:PI3K/PI4K catalytic domain-containing protein n=1 Tax=Entamoeba dispar (strain ATCC PRA-260 / SAW760) TaxID=370354 RepID=B0EK94_ENTDS|nr:uncharacterized protein EDI_136780 [Entamoeba dispar SAW760]EDR25058.1 hypothetical protein EDI_136780 [Entamoeba dispar SAW760]|eukprot:EDR25058.1 hypothetical protein EDI_136780 [Entamoeba dispar SAW760]
MSKRREIDNKEEFNILQDIAMETLSRETIERIGEDIKISNKYLDIIMEYIKKLRRGIYKKEMIEGFMKMIKKNKEIIIRVMIKHRGKGKCICEDQEFQKYYQVEWKEKRCGVIEIIRREKEMKEIVESEEGIEEMIEWFDKIYNIKEIEGQTLYFDKRLIEEEIINKKEKEELFKERISIIDWKCEIDPFFTRKKILCLRGIKKYKTSNGPIEIQVTLESKEGIEIKTIIYKKGDDLRKDEGAEISFNIFNVIWKRFLNKNYGININNKEIIGKAKTYGVIALREGGIIEKIGCTPMKVLCKKHRELTCCIDGKIYEEYSQNKCLECYKQLNIEKLNLENKIKLIESLVGGFIGGYIIGLRDRHLENMKIDLCESTFFHIDFGYLLNERPKFDANLFAIPSVLRNQLQKIIINQNQITMNAWDIFLFLSSKSFIILRRNNEMILNLLLLIFSFIDGFSIDLITNTIKNSFHILDSELLATNKLLDDILSVSFQKIIKDNQHEILSWIRNN